MNNKSDLLDEPANFSFGLGGPHFQFFLRARLSGPALELLLRRIIIITAVAWLPLLLLTAVQGHVISGVPVPFLYALDAHARLVVVLPLLIGSEIYVHDWSRGIIARSSIAGSSPLKTARGSMTLSPPRCACATRFPWNWRWWF